VDPDWLGPPELHKQRTADRYTANNRRSDFDLCRSIFGELIPIIIFQNFLPLKKVSC
jgi:hypothetical protein